MVVKITGLDEVLGNLKRLQHKAHELDGTHPVRLDELFPPAFLQRHSTFPSIDALVAASGFDIKTAEDFKRVPDDHWDAFIRSATTFSSWQEMLQKAAAEWTAARLGLT